MTITLDQDASATRVTKPTLRPPVSSESKGTNVDSFLSHDAESPGTSVELVNSVAWSMDTLNNWVTLYSASTLVYDTSFNPWQPIWQILLESRLRDLASKSFDNTDLTKPSKEALRRASEFTKKLHASLTDIPFPAVLPSEEDDSVILLWQEKKHVIRIEIGSNEDYVWIYDRDSETFVDGELNNHENRIQMLFQSLINS
ncbi:MAG: hypothetical protein HKL80_01790 [Acidimicrobiales bacterium]|nr:hypothetical protein [Acidimicrobiales bacterium]